MEEKYRDDALATVVSGLVLVCLLALPDRHPVVIVQSGDVWTLPVRQQERAKPWHPGDAGLVVERRVGTRLSNRTAVQATGTRTLPTAMSVRNLGQMPGFLGSQAILDGERNQKSLLSPLTLTVMSL